MFNQIKANRPSNYRPKVPLFARAVNRKFAVQQATDSVEISIYDEIGYWGVTAADLRDRLDGISADAITLNINSPGGDVFDGIAMFNDLKQHDAEITVNVTGLAASAASLIAMAGDSINIAANAAIMIHNAWGVSVGDQNDTRAFAEVLSSIDNSLAETYAVRTGGDKKAIAAQMDAETWFTGKEAVDAGFADAVTGEEEVSARFDLSLYAHAPDHLTLEGLPPIETKRDLEAALRDVGYSQTQAKAAIATAVANEVPQRDVVGNDTLAAMKRCIETLKS